MAKTLEENEVYETTLQSTFFEGAILKEPA